MTHTTVAGEIANRLLKDAKKLEQSGLPETHEQALDNRQQAAKARKLARLQDLTVREAACRKKLADGSYRDYYRWLASWRIGERTVTKYCGASRGNRAVSEKEALIRARRLKRESLQQAGVLEED